VLGFLWNDCSTENEAQRPQKMPYYPNPHQTRARDIEGGEDKKTRATIRRDTTGDVPDRGHEAGNGRREEGGERNLIRKWEKDIHDTQEENMHERWHM